MGIGMIEILVTVFILAIGLLGIAGTQFMSKRANYEATQRTTATLLANDILERMRANSSSAALEQYVAASTVANGFGGGNIASEPSSTNIFLHDLWEWEQAIDGATEKTGVGEAAVATGGLVKPTACIYTSVPGITVNKSGEYMVAIVWRGTAKLSDPTNPEGTPVPDPYDCGRDSGNYDSDDATPVVNAHRRILIVKTYIMAE